MTNILLVGASSGIGHEVMRSLTNARIWTAGRHRPDLEQEGHLSWDATNEAFPTSLLPEELHGMVYTPGSITLGPFNRLLEKQFRDDLEINLLGAIKAIQGSLPALKKSKSASIVLFSTVAVATGMPMHASVAAAKGAVEGLTRALAAEFAPTIRVNAIAPSLTDTPLASGLLKTERQLAAAAARHPLERIGTVRDIASAVKYLLSPDSSWVTGQILKVDGGLSSVRRFN